MIAGADVTIRDSSVLNARIHGIRVSSAHARVDDCALTGTGKAAVAASEQAGLAITGCRIDGVHGTGISYLEQSRGVVTDTR